MAPTAIIAPSTYHQKIGHRTKRHNEKIESAVESLLADAPTSETA
jgi:hypothetical protein